ncbi:hypothetical protein [Caldisalinibacter kiritimatiensis]|uniref:Small, acid-soluble spore protein, alpha/beta type n=1 Tax=Caldisalinibacter kiritimatiensis TaxID=1304284 RepID=R1AS89_9FIRM|nr:hypothetical protein [Caldisalinibacter kiritimatiensis]EOC99506.1 hypothetical protein L21TH_2511 [Caldisalinibacter kiritimatiensis]
MKNKISTNARRALQDFKEELGLEMKLDLIDEKTSKQKRNAQEDASSHLGRS